MTTKFIHQNISEVAPSLKPPNKRVTMIKHVVGKVRSSSHCLPEDDFVFGIANKLDQEGAGQVLVQSWTESERIHPKNKIKSFPLTNKEALQNGCLTAKAQREYSKHNAVMKQNPKSLIYKRNTTTLTEQMKKNQIVYGIKSFANDATMTELLRCTGGNTQNDQEMDYPDRSRMQKKGRLPPAKSTKSSRLLQEFTKPMSKECVAYIKAKEEFKMKKFMNVKSKVKSIRKGFDLTHHTHHTHHKQEVQI